MTYKIGICGLGFVGNAIYNTLKEMNNLDIYIYDLYKNINTQDILLNTDILFLCLPTPYDINIKEYSKKELENTLEYLNDNNYTGTILIKSTIEPTTTNNYCTKYNKLSLIHNPEFLSARTAQEDFKNQSHIILGVSNTCNKNNVDNVVQFYKEYFTDNISICESTVAETVKVFCNSFYAVKIQYFTELYLTCNKININYDDVKELMLKNNWINYMHTSIPGHDNQISYGGMCFPKDTNALNSFMEKINTPHGVLNATIEERNKMRID